MFNTADLIKVFVNPLNVVYFTVIAFILGLVIAWLYKNTNKSVSYSQTFIESLVLLLPVITIIILFISNNIARAIGVFGAFSVVRFRTAIKDSKDMFFIFWVLATGLVIGVGEITTAFITTATVGLMVYILHWTGFGKFADYDYLLIYSMDTRKTDTQKISNLLKEHTVKQDVLNVQSSKDGKELEVTTTVTLRKKVTVDMIIAKLKDHKGIKSMSINPAKFELEY